MVEVIIPTQKSDSRENDLNFHILQIQGITSIPKEDLVHLNIQGEFSEHPVMVSLMCQLS